MWALFSFWKGDVIYGKQIAEYWIIVKKVDKKTKNQEKTNSA